MEQNNSFQKVLDRVEKKAVKLWNQIRLVKDSCQGHQMQMAYEQAMRLEETAERLVLLTRVLPAYTGSAVAGLEVDNIMRLCIPVDMGFTAEGWFRLCIPALLPKKGDSSADYIRSFLYPAMREYFQKKEPVRFTDCVLVYRHVYDRERPERRMRDHDNIEMNMVSDIVAMYVMSDDAPSVCSHYECSIKGEDDHTEVYVVPKTDFPKWLLQGNKSRKEVENTVKNCIDMPIFHKAICGENATNMP